MQVRNLPQQSKKKEFQTSGVHLTLVAPEHQEMNGQIEVTCSMLRTISHYLMLHARVSEAYIFILN